jgi:hypothetical protein
MQDRVEMPRPSFRRETAQSLFELVVIRTPASADLEVVDRELRRGGHRLYGLFSFELARAIRDPRAVPCRMARIRPRRSKSSTWNWGLGDSGGTLYLDVTLK